ncbi:hypothetical protein FCM35_KLT19971 [Carex littledalei]|uniref:Uncharacterized protein n=1 Tax=Carex littledalei TaxID=544730 RepID=A0A833UYI3_9POAL|nr:hypothetical protein FCM35_KLT22034 [Carex littledalei]KAF3335464.1 hypothetical protein FCM35_KLT19971 [Carex littledalei]
MDLEKKDLKKEKKRAQDTRALQPSEVRSKSKHARTRDREEDRTRAQMKQQVGDALPQLEHPFGDEDERLIRQHREMAFVEIEGEDEDIPGVVNSGFSAEMMEVDDRDDPVDVLLDLDKHLHPVDSDFFNSFADDFDDTDLS